MRIALNAIWSNGEPCDGHTVYCHNILKQIIRLGEMHEYLVYHYGPPRFEFLKSKGNVHSLSLKKCPLISKLIQRYRPYLAEEIRVTKALMKFRPHILFQVGHWADFVYYPCKKVHTIHDLAFLRSEYKAYFPGPMARELKQFTERRVADSSYLIAVSENTKQDLIEYYGFPSERIAVIGHGFDKRLFNTEKVNGSDVYQKFSITEPFIVSVGVLQPRKNFDRLINAFNALKKAHRIPHKLVIIGGRAWQYEHIEALPGQLGIEKDVVFTGVLPVEDLASLLKNAALFALPALYEGFGIPVIEAMACGTPVVASNVGAIPEVLGDAGLQVDPYSVEDIADKILQVLNSPALQAVLVKRGLKKAEGYSWERAALETLAVFRKVA
ncbi:MAG: glycosyltransferase family 1 protein [Deltaproteobacteria bacterium]|nr:glycosyltransferase family 1 protein [Deltaproteobacteria bacterium]